jgi:hypothetical protein
LCTIILLINHFSQPAGPEKIFFGDFQAIHCISHVQNPKFSGGASRHRTKWAQKKSLCTTFLLIIFLLIIFAIPGRLQGKIKNVLSPVVSIYFISRAPCLTQHQQLGILVSTFLSTI